MGQASQDDKGTEHSGPVQTDKDGWRGHTTTHTKRITVSILR